MADYAHTAIDEVLQGRVRLAIVAFLAGAGRVDFRTIRDATETTDGNASVHLRKLEEAGYVSMEKKFVGRKPQTSYALTEKGGKALRDYVSHLETLLPDAGNGQGKGTGKG
ncbi:winged helix-turn-helix domain-containing protein [Parvibaculum sp. MBR-TMA-1.3b-4.2]|jgi:DNA-binding PadR family transcriptional regulator